MEQRLLTEKEVMEYIKVSRPTARKRMQEIGATLHIGNRVLYDKSIIDEYINKQIEMENAIDGRQSI